MNHLLKIPFSHNLLKDSRQLALTTQVTFSNPNVDEVNCKSCLCNTCGVLEHCALQPACLPELLQYSALDHKWKGGICLSTLWVD